MYVMYCVTSNYVLSDETNLNHSDRGSDITDITAQDMLILQEHKVDTERSNPVFYTQDSTSDDKDSLSTENMESVMMNTE